MKSLGVSRYVPPVILTSAPIVDYNLPEGERSVRSLYRDILKWGYEVVKVEQDEYDYLVYLEKEMAFEDGAEFISRSCYRLRAQ